MTVLPAGSEGPPFEPPLVDVGAFEQGSAASRWALSRYLVGRAIAESLSRGLLIIAVALLVLAGLIEWGGATGWAVLVVVLALGVLLVRAALSGLLRRLTAARLAAPLRAQLQRLVGQTRRDVRAELRRLGLPSRSVTLPLIALRLARRRRRAATLAALRQFRVENVVPATRLDELHLLLRGIGSADTVRG